MPTADELSTRDEAPAYPPGLAPADRLWATWRAAPALPCPAPPPFTRAEALRRLAAVPVIRWGWDWDWAALGLGPTLAPEEARFWLVALAYDRTGLTPAGLAARLAAADLAAPLTPGEVQTLAREARFPTPHLVAPLAALLAPEDLLALVAGLAPGCAPAPEGDEPYTSLREGWRVCVLPYLEPAERARLGRSLAGQLDPAHWPADLLHVAPPAFYLAALLGGAEAALGRLVAGWADERYGAEGSDFYQRPQLIVFGLGDPALVERQMRRLALRLTSPEHVRAWLAHTGLGALDLVRDSILAMGNKPEAAALTAALAAVGAPAVAPVMLELVRGSKAPQAARAWLEAHPEEAIAGLLPLAAGAGGAAEQAIELLRGYARRGHEARIVAGLAALAPADAARLRAVLLDAPPDAPPRLDASTAPPWLHEALAGAADLAAVALPAWLRPPDLPALAVGAGRLGDEQLALLLRALTRCTLEAAHPLAAAVRAHVAPAARDALAWAVCEQWLADDAPFADKWVIAAAGWLGDERCARELTPLILDWPGDAQHLRAIQSIKALGLIGGDTALRQLGTIARTSKLKGLRTRAAACVEEIASRRGPGPA